MSAPLPVELRRRVVEAFENNEGTQGEIAARFKVGIATVGRWVRRARTDAPLESTWRRRGPERKLTQEHLEVLRRLAEREPDVTLDELRDLFVAEASVVVSRATIGRALRDSLGWTRKKRR